MRVQGSESEPVNEEDCTEPVHSLPQTGQAFGTEAPPSSAHASFDRSSYFRFRKELQRRVNKSSTAAETAALIESQEVG